MIQWLTKKSWNCRAALYYVSQCLSLQTALVGAITYSNHQVGAGRRLKVLSRPAIV